MVLSVAAEKSLLFWCDYYRAKGEKGNQLEFKSHAFLRDILDDWTPVQVVRKASQVGFSTAQILKSLHAARYRNYNIIYTLPTFNDVGQFVPSKVNPIIQHNPILANWTKDKDTIFQKRVGNSFIYYRGTHTTKGAKKEMEAGTGIMLTADLLVMDEADRSVQAILEQYESRLEASEYRGRWYFSNPTHPQTLSQKLWEESDQKHWFIKCSHCGEWQYLRYPDSIADGKFVCIKCGGEITDEDRQRGEWIAKYQNRPISGYWINHLICSWKTAAEIETAAKTKTKEYFYNFVLGLPYRGSDVVVDADLIASCIDHSSPNFLKDNVMGVDVGLTKHYVIGNAQGIFKVGTAQKWEEIEFLIRKYDIRQAVIDAMPDQTAPRELRDKYRGIVWLAYFRREIKKGDFVFWDKKSHSVYTDRSQIIQQVINEFSQRKIRFQMSVEDLSEYIQHWENIYMVKEEDSLGIERNVWESDGADHYVFATVYWRLAMIRGVGRAAVSEGKNKPASDVATNIAPDVREIASRSYQHLDWRL